VSSTVSLPDAARARVVALAAERLSALAEEQVPAAVRPFRRFTPRKRAQLAAVPLAAALEDDAAFRQLVSEGLADDVVAAVRSGRPLPAAPPEELAAAAYLLRSAGWQERLTQESAALAERDRAAAGAAGVDAVQRLTEQLEAVRTQARAEVQRLGAQLQAAQEEVSVLRRRVRDMGSRAAAAERALAAGPPAQGPPAEGPADLPDGPEPVEDVDAAEVRRLRSRLAAAEQALTAARAGARGDRQAEQVRLRVLLDALIGAAGGLRRELALPPVDERPADAVAAAYAQDCVARAPVQGRAPDDPTLLDALLLVPGTHLLVDGYNVTKTGYGEQTLEVQRGRLLTGLGALASRTGAEVTVVFDGAGQDAPRTQAVAAPRGVRLIFSPVDVIADDVLRELVGAEPPGRPLVVVSNDREVADDVRRLGAHALASQALLVLLSR